MDKKIRNLLEELRIGLTTIYAMRIKGVYLYALTPGVNKMRSLT
jgi:hypothetical protein